MMNKKQIRISQELSSLPDIVDKIDFLSYGKKLMTKYQYIIKQKKKFSKDNKYLYYCTNCHKFFYADNVKFGKKIKCSNCNHRYLVMRYNAKFDYDMDFITYLEMNENKDIIARVFCYKEVYINRLFEDKNIIDTKSAVFFLRKNDDPESSLVTIEIDPINKVLLQCRAYKNDKPKNKELNFVKEWCQSRLIDYSSLTYTT